MNNTSTSQTYLLLELITIYLILPAMIYIWSPHPLLPFLWFIAFICGVMLFKDKSFKKNMLWALPPVIPYKVILIQAITSFIVTAIFLYLTAPESLFSLIKINPLLWLLVMLLYPILSVYPQELIYRGFFFHRYSNLIRNPSLSIGLNALLFGYMHIIFHNWIAVILTLVGGLYFAMLYQRSHSVLFVSIVHAIYGNLLFTLGLGQYFYHGSIETIAQTFKF